MSEPICGVSVWRWGIPYVCDMKPGHEPPHVDSFADGMEWA
jgi:hypothetical protein